MSKKIMRTIKYISRTSSSVTIMLSCGHSFTLQTDPLFVEDIASVYRKKRLLGRRIACQQCAQEAHNAE